jgi:hypothetical protein
VVAIAMNDSEKEKCVPLMSTVDVSEPGHPRSVNPTTWLCSDIVRLDKHGRPSIDSFHSHIIRWEVTGKSTSQTGAKLRFDLSGSLGTI